MPRSILATLSIWYLNMNIDPFITLVKVKVKVPDTYGVIISSPKQYDFDISKVKVT